jgi:hypothetical protein
MNAGRRGVNGGTAAGKTGATATMPIRVIRR